MSFLTDAERDALEIRRMIFHVVGHDPEDLVLLDEIAPPQHADFFIERVKHVLRGNVFEFRDGSATEDVLRAITLDPLGFADGTRTLATAFQSRHVRATSTGVFFVFELSVGGDDAIFALIKYDHDDVVRYMLRGDDIPEVPRLERFRESFVRKPEAMQKIALVRLTEGGGGRLIVHDRSRRTHISDYFESFLHVRRVNDAAGLSGKLVDALKRTFKAHREELSPEFRRGGVERIYEVLNQEGRSFDPEDCQPLVAAVFGDVAPDSAVHRTLANNLKKLGVAGEAFDLDLASVQRPRRRRLETEEGTQVTYHEDYRPTISDRPDGRKQIVIVTSRITQDDVEA